MTFIVNQDGIVFQRDLGSKHGESRGGGELFDPDPRWARLDVVHWANRQSPQDGHPWQMNSVYPRTNERATLVQGWQ